MLKALGTWYLVLGLGSWHLVSVLETESPVVDWKVGLSHDLAAASTVRTPFSLLFA